MAQNQHYVPQHLLRNFSQGDRERVHVFDKHTGRSFTTSVRNVLAERRFNDFQLGEFEVSAEPAMGKLEDMVIGALARVIEARSLASLSTEERAHLCYLMAFQFLRTKHMRDNFQAINDGIVAKIEAMGGDPNEVRGFKPLDDNSLKAESVRFLVKALPEFAKTISLKVMLLMETSADRPFYLGDSPVVMSNSERIPGPFGNIGLGVRGIEIYMPLSATLVLGAWCPSIIEKFEQGRVEHATQRRQATMLMTLGRNIDRERMNAFMEQANAIDEKIGNMLTTVKNGQPLNCDEDHLTHLNSLQVAFARRYVICPRADFDLARRMLRDDPSLARGIQPEVN